MATPLPYADWIKQPITWTPTDHRLGFRSGSSRMSVTTGFHPVTFGTTLEYIILPSEAFALLAELKALDYNNVYTFTCRTAGPVAAQVLTGPTYQEWHDGLRVRVMLPVERIR